MLLLLLLECCFRWICGVWREVVVDFARERRRWVLEVFCLVGGGWEREGVEVWGEEMDEWVG